jgi:ferredoxin
MAIIRFEGREAELPDGSHVLDTCEELGMPLGCHDGLCGACVSTVVGGMENLSPKNDKELDMDLADHERLPCQCVVTSGVVEFAVN